MKALFFYGELYLGLKEIERLQPDIQFPISKSLSGIKGFNDPFPLVSLKEPNTMRLEFRLEDSGREYAIYKLKGFV